MAGRYEIYLHKKTEGTPNQPISPSNEIGASPRNETNILKIGAITAVGVTVARRGINTLRTEISKTTGNERLQTNMNNAMKLVGYGAAITAGGIPGAVLVTADIALNAITYHRDLTRTNRETQLDNKLNGKRVNISKGSAYYD